VIVRGKKSAAAAAAVAPSRDGLPSFDRPPVTEVVCGFVFEPLQGFLLPHAGVYWEAIRREFPECAHAAPLGIDGSPGWQDEATGLPLPRLWFISEDKRELLQLQGDCFYFNWRRRDEHDVYPRFSAVFDGFKQQLAVFLRFLEEQKLPAPVITGCDLTYVNHIPQDVGWNSVEDLSAVFRDFRWESDTSRFLPTPRAVSWSNQFVIPEGGILTSNGSIVKRVRDQLPVVKFEMQAKVKTNGGAPDAHLGWFDVAHKWIVNGFVDLTRSEIQQKAWRRNG